MSLASLFQESPNLPSIPKVVQELIEKFNDPDSNSDEISKKIQMDSVISAKIMRLANSARYGAGRKISSIDSAVVLLGIDALKTLVVASGVTGAFKEIPGFDRKQFWRDSFMIASICKLIAKHTDSDAETAFTIGMMHNIGELLIHIVYHEEAVKIDKLVEAGAVRTDLQDNQWGFDYTHAGEELAKRWKFPEIVSQGIRQQNAPNDFDDYSPYAGIVYLAKYLNDAFKREEDNKDILSNFPADMAKPLNIDLLSFFEELVELSEAEDDIEELLRD